MHRTWSRARTGLRYGDAKLVDHMAWDGLTNPYDGQSMGVFAEATADKYGFTREAQDAYTIESVKRAQAAIASGAFAAEIVPVKVAAQERRRRIRHRRTAGQVRYRQDSDAERRLQERRHGDRRQFVEHFRRRRGDRAA